MFLLYFQFLLNRPDLPPFSSDWFFSYSSSSLLRMSSPQEPPSLEILICAGEQWPNTLFHCAKLQTRSLTHHWSSQMSQLTCISCPFKLKIFHSSINSSSNLLICSCKAYQLPGELTEAGTCLMLRLLGTWPGALLKSWTSRGRMGLAIFLHPLLIW